MEEKNKPGLFIEAVRVEMDTRLKAIRRQLNREAFYDLMGWELPENGWRAIFRGTEGARD